MGGPAYPFFSALRVGGSLLPRFLTPPRLPPFCARSLFRRSTFATPCPSTCRFLTRPPSLTRLHPTSCPRYLPRCFSSHFSLCERAFSGLPFLSLSVISGRSEAPRAPCRALRSLSRSALDLPAVAHCCPALFCTVSVVLSLRSACLWLFLTRSWPFAPARFAPFFAVRFFFPSGPLLSPPRRFSL